MKKKKFKAKDGKKYTITRVWAYKNKYFCNKGKQKKANIENIVIHNTGNHGRDTALANARYFKNKTGVYGGAHIIIDADGNIVQSGRLTDACYSVGGSRYPNYKQTGGANYYSKCNNYNQVSIELAGIVDYKPTKKQIAATKAVIEYIKKYCHNVKRIIRHFDVTGKDCPQRYSGKANEKAWAEFKKKIQ